MLYTEKEEVDIIINNTIKMLYNRGWIQSFTKELVDKVIKSEDEMEFTLKDKNVYKIKFFLQKVSSIKKTSIEDFLVDNKNNHKILIVSEINPKVKMQIMEFGKVEIFIKEELMFTVIEHILVPKHYLLSEEEKQDFLTEYIVKPKELPRMYITDPIAKYYYAKNGDIFRIERPSLTSGYSIAYRVVVNN